MRRTKEDTEISKLRILIAAEAEFCQRGFVAANMDTIARAAGMTKGAIFWHYGSKVGLFSAIMKRATERVKSIFNDTFSAPEPPQILEKCRIVFKQIKKDNAFNVLLMLGNIDKTKDIPGRVVQECKKGIAEILDQAGAVLAEAKQRGELKPDANIQTMLISMILVMSGFAKIKEFKSLIDPIGGTIDDESVINTLFNGLLSFQRESSS